MKTKRSFFFNPFSFVLYHLSFVLTLSSFIFYLSSCQRSTAPVYATQKLQLTVVDVSCTEAWLRLKTEQTEKAEKDLVLQVFRNDSLVVNKDWDAGDSLIYLDGLQPATAYAFSAKLLRDKKLLFSSPKVTATTMDTTSHDFTWQTFEFGGQGGSSYFNDVAIIDENDIWAVGEIYTADDKYNAAHWNGEKWELKKIFIRGYFYPLKTIIAFGANDIWVANLTLIHFNGEKIDYYTTPPLDENGNAKRINKIWGTSDNDLYIVGNDGMIAHYDGQQWQRIESGTDEKINDIYGNIEGEKKIIYCVFGKTLTQSIPGVIKIDSSEAIEVQWPYQDRIPHSIWFDKPGLLYVAGGEVALRDYTSKWRIISNLPRYYIKRIRGNANNDLFIAGAYSILAHFNGLGWHLYEYGNGSKHYESLDFKNNLIVIVGHISGRVAFIKIGKR